jgi:ribosomal protein S18 acetylase RimI-like enzyme
MQFPERKSRQEVVRVLRTYVEVVAAAAGDPFARWDLDPTTPLSGHQYRDAVAWTVAREHYEARPWLNAIGPAEDVALLVGELLRGRRGALDVEPDGITVPHGTIPLLDAELRPPEHGDWVWWWTDREPPVRAGEDRAAWLDLDAAAVDGAHAAGSTVRDELVALLAVANPTASTEPGDSSVRSWMGIRDATGRLVACAADRPSVSAVPHLASIATHPDARGHGLGAAVTAAITRHGFTVRGAPAVTLGMYASNDVGRALYTRLGFRAAHHFTSGRLPHQP